VGDPIKWFRLYGEAVDDEKLRLLAFEDRWHFIAILCCKAQGILDQVDDLMRRKVAVKLGLAARELDEVARRLEEVGLIDAATLQPKAWDKRQFKSDDSTERVRAHRERMKRFRNVSETAPETETETETERERGIKKRASPRGERLPHDDLPKDWLTFCQSERPDLDPDSVFARFADYWRAQPGAKGRKSDWSATWRNWVRDERQRPRAVKADDQFAGAI